MTMSVLERKAVAPAHILAWTRIKLPTQPRAEMILSGRGLSLAASAAGLFALFFDFLLFFRIHFFDLRVLVSRASCLSSCDWRAGIRNGCLLRTRLRRSCCGGVGSVGLGAVLTGGVS